jgi:hypothetical protein
MARFTLDQYFFNAVNIGYFPLFSSHIHYSYFTLNSSRQKAFKGLLLIYATGFPGSKTATWGQNGPADVPVHKIDGNAAD